MIEVETENVFKLAAYALQVGAFFILALFTALKMVLIHRFLCF